MGYCCNCFQQYKVSWVDILAREVAEFPMSTTPFARPLWRSIPPRPKPSVLSSPATRRHRPFSTSDIRRRPTASSKQIIALNKPPAAGEEFLQRVHDRPLPTLKELSSSRRWLRTMPIFIVVCAASAMGIFNYQKTSSPIIAATLYSLRTNARARQELGDEVYFASQWAWIWGPINLVQGHVDVSFRVKGTKSQGMCRFKATRYGGRGGMFKTDEWSLTMDDGRCIQLLEDEAAGPDAPGAGPLGAALF